MRVLHHNTHVQEVSHAESPRKKTLILNKFLRAHCYSMKALIKTEEMASDEPIKMKSGTLTRKRPRSMGSFPCPSCDKIFKRSDHLSRHYLNHDPKEVYECDFLIEGLDGTSRKCGRTFVRRDLKERHTKRHVEEAALKRRKTEEIQSPLINQDPPVLPQMTPPEGVSEGLVQPQVMVLPPQTRAQPQPQTQTQTNTHTQTLALALALVPPVQPVVQVQQPHTFHPAVPMNMQPNVQSMNTGGTQGMQPQPQSQSLADFDYSQHNPNMPPTQNDILSWLFIDSPPNVVLSPEQQKLRDQLMALPYTQLRNMNGSLNPSIIAPTPPLSILPPPMSFSFSQQQLQPPPLPQHTQQQQAQFQNQNAQFPLQMMLEDPSLTPFYSNSQYNTNVNLFSNSDNPLDEIFLKSLPENSALNVNNPFFVNGTTGSNSTNGTGTTGSLGFNFMPSTASSSSPITTNDSTPRARTGSVNGSTTSSYVITITDVINNHAKWSNVPKMGHLFIDTLILELCLSSVNVSRSTVEKLFDPGKDGESTNLSEVSLLEDRFSYYLSLYWTIFHPQYTIIHRPSFSTKTCPHYFF